MKTLCLWWLVFKRLPFSTMWKYHVLSQATSLWIFHCLSQIDPFICEYHLICNKWPIVIFLKVTLRYFILTFDLILFICEFLLFLHNTNIFVKIYVYFTMVKYLVFSIDLFISYYILKSTLWKFFCFSLLHKKHAW